MKQETAGFNLLYAVFHATLDVFSFPINIRCSMVPHSPVSFQCYASCSNKISMTP